MKTLRNRLLPILLSAAMLTACGSDGEKATKAAEKPERPTTAQVSESFKERFRAADPTAEKDPMFTKVADCFGELVVESDLSDEAVTALVENDQEYQFTDADLKTIDSFSQESAGECVRELVKETGGVKQEPEKKAK